MLLHSVEQIIQIFQESLSKCHQSISFGEVELTMHYAVCQNSYQTVLLPQILVVLRVPVYK